MYVDLKFDKGEQYESMKILFGRRNPYVITEIKNVENSALLESALASLGPYTVLETISSPKQLFHFLREHQNDLIVVRADIFAMRKNCVDIMEGAVCSNPDGGGLWSVSYASELSFKFQGKLILCTNKTRQEIAKDKRFDFFSRDCQFI